MCTEILEQIAKSLTPQQLRTVILDLAREQPAGSRNSVGVATIAQALMGEGGLGSGREGWEAYLRLKEIIRARVAQIPGIKYVENE